MSPDALEHQLLPEDRIAGCLEDAAFEIICRVPRRIKRSELLPRPIFNRDQAEMLVRRLGLDGDAPCTLQEAADLKGVSRERVRQLQSKLDEWLERAGPQPDHLLPSVVFAAIEVASSTPIDQLAEHLQRTGLARGRWALPRLVQLLHVCGRDDLNELLAESTARDDAAALVKELGVRAVWTQSGKSGFAQVASVRNGIRSRLVAMESPASRLSDETIDQLIRLADGVLDLPHGYLFGAPHDDPTIVETAKRMLLVCDVLPLRVIRSGVRRRCRFRQIPFNLPLDTLRKFFSLHHSFEIDTDDNIRARSTVSVHDEDTVQMWIVNELRASDYGMLTRHQVMQRARNARQNTSSVAIYLTYGEQIVHDRRGFFYAVGSPPDESVVEVALDVAEAVVRDTSQSWHFDASTNTLTGLIELGDSALAGGVVFADGQSKGYLNLLLGRRFRVIGDGEQTFGNVGVSEVMSALTGLSTLFAHTFPEPGDLLRLEINLDDGVARAEVGGSEIDEMST
jgi:hypothetical protein